MKNVKFEDMMIPPIAIGTWSWGKGENGSDDVFGNTYTLSDLEPVFHKAVNMGFNLFDTAFVYGMGSSEKILGSLIKKNSNKVIISTKFTPDENSTRDELKESLNGSLERLNINCIDIYWIHVPEDVEKWTTEIIPYVKDKKIKYVGVSNHNLQQVKNAYEILKKENIKLAAVQNHLSLVYRKSENDGLLKWCKENNVLFFSYMVLEQGFLTGKYSEHNTFKKGSYRDECYGLNKFVAVKPLINVMQSVAEKYNVSISAVAIQWAISKGTVPIVGVTKEKYLKDLSDAAEIKLSFEDINMLEETADSLNMNMKAEWE